MSFYLLDHKPAQQQFHPSRPRPMSGGVLIHTTESIMDNVGPDTGAENVANFIRNRREYGSYHVIVDSDSAVALVPDTYTAFHCGASGYNGSTWGISFACATTDLNVNADWTRKAMRIAAQQIVGFWQRNGFNAAAANQFIPAGDTRTRPGMSTHGEAQPADRSDAWTRHPQRPQLEALLRNEIAALSATTPSIPTPPGVDLTVNKPVMMQEPANYPNGAIWLYYTDSPFRVHVKSPSDVNVWRFMGVELKQIDAKTADFFRRYTQEVKCG